MILDELPTTSRNPRVIPNTSRIKPVFTSLSAKALIYIPVPNTFSYISKIGQICCQSPILIFPPSPLPHILA